MPHVFLYPKISRYKKARITCHYGLRQIKQGLRNSFLFFLQPSPTALDSELVPSAPMPTHIAKQVRQALTFMSQNQGKENSPLAWVNTWTLWHQLSTAV